MLLKLSLEILIILIPILIFSLCFHEFAHGYIAYKLGDNTAERNGRLTLNPLHHLDPIGSLMILFVGFGWAKPVPVNPSNFKNPRNDMIKVAFAGPASNLILSLIAGSIMRLNNILLLTSNESILIALYFFIFINISLAIFNLIPIAPLDGSQIFGNYISKYNPNIAWKLQIYGPKILMAIILIGIITPISPIALIMMPIIKIFMFLFSGINF
jgi:Zn-dependent protease